MFTFCSHVAANIEVREYQQYIVQKALFTNTLVALPTGLGKTFIAAVVMYNYFRWFPEGNVCYQTGTFYLSYVVFHVNRRYLLTNCSSYLINLKSSGKIVFTAPSRPLVAQQIEACHNTVGIPQVLKFIL